MLLRWAYTFQLWKLSELKSYDKLVCLRMFGSSLFNVYLAKASSSTEQKDKNGSKLEI